jgi:tetraacyldisaccharide 4'-kinase
MREPAFWWRRAGALAALLAPAAALCGAVAAARMRRQGRAPGIPVVCVGNFTLGGAGKTPAAMTVARLLMAHGERPFFLSRGYGGRQRGPLRVDSRAHRASDVGDEPLLLEKIAPTIVARDRVAGAALARVGGASVIVMDDGLQNPSLAKEFTIAVIDAERGIGNARVFPAGPLRAPLDAQLEKTDAVLVVGDAKGAVAPIEAARARHLPVFTGRLVPDARAVAELLGRRVLAFAGIGHPEKFFATLSAAGIDVVGRAAFPDHHRYAAADAASLLAQADRENLLLVTTEKDMARLAGEPALASLMARARALPVALELDDEGAFRALLLRKIGKS